MKKINGVGINDYEGKVSCLVGGKKRFLKSYDVWRNMLKRCYSSEYQEKYPTYKGCKVSQEWLIYSNFKEWFDENYPLELSEEIKFDLDKDLLGGGSKVYSYKTCVFIPQKINKFLSNVYKNNTSGYIGVVLHKRSGRFQSQIRDFETGKKKYLGSFMDPVEASGTYITARKYMALLAKNYMRDLNIYSEDIISKIK